MIYKKSNFQLVFAVVISTLLITMSYVPTSLSQNPTNPSTEIIKGGITSTSDNGTSTSPAWIVGGVFQLSNLSNSMDSELPSSTTTTMSPQLNASFYMIKIDGTSEHIHDIYDFKLIEEPIVNDDMNITHVIYNGTSTVTMRDGPVTDVPTQINLMGDSAISITLDGSMIDDHFGSQPIYGTQHLICVEKPILCQ